MTRRYGRCDAVTWPRTQYMPAEYCDADTHPDHDRCPRHDGPDPDDTDYDLTEEDACRP